MTSLQGARTSSVVVRAAMTAVVVLLVIATPCVDAFNLTCGRRGAYRARNSTVTHTDLGTVAGTGVVGFVDNTNAMSAQLSSPSSVVYHPATGVLYVTDSGNNRVRSITPDGRIATVAGSGIAGTTDSTNALTATFNTPHDIDIDPNTDALYIACGLENRVRKVDLALNAVVTVAGSGAAGSSDHASNPLQSKFDYPWTITVDVASQRVFVGDKNNNRVRLVPMSGPTSSAFTISSPGGVKINPTDSSVLYVISTSTYALYSYAFASPGLVQIATVLYPTGLAADFSRNVLYVSSAFGHRMYMKTMGDASAASVVAGTGVAGSADAMPATLGAVNMPAGVTFDTFSGALIVAESGGHKVRAVRTLATSCRATWTGTATASFSFQSTGSESKSLNGTSSPSEHVSSSASRRGSATVSGKTSISASVTGSFATSSASLRGSATDSVNASISASTTGTVSPSRHAASASATLGVSRSSTGTVNISFSVPVSGTRTLSVRISATVSVNATASTPASVSATPTSAHTASLASSTTRTISGSLPAATATESPAATASMRQTPSSSLARSPSVSFTPLRTPTVTHSRLTRTATRPRTVTATPIVVTSTTTATTAATAPPPSTVSFTAAPSTTNTTTTPIATPPTAAATAADTTTTTTTPSSSSTAPITTVANTSTVATATTYSPATTTSAPETATAAPSPPPAPTRTATIAVSPAPSVNGSSGELVTEELWLRLSGDSWDGVLSLGGDNLVRAVQRDLAVALGVGTESVVVQSLSLGSLIVEAEITHDADSNATALLLATNYQESRDAYSAVDAAGASAIRVIGITVTRLAGRGTPGGNNTASLSSFADGCGGECQLLLIVCGAAIALIVLGAIAFAVLQSSACFASGDDAKTASDEPELAAIGAAADEDSGKSSNGSDRAEGRRSGRNRKQRSETAGIPISDPRASEIASLRAASAASAWLPGEVEEPVVVDNLDGSVSVTSPHRPWWEGEERRRAATNVANPMADGGSRPNSNESRRSPSLAMTAPGGRHRARVRFNEGMNEVTLYDHRAVLIAAHHGPTTQQLQQHHQRTTAGFEPLPSDDLFVVISDSAFQQDAEGSDPLEHMACESVNDDPLPDVANVADDGSLWFPPPPPPPQMPSTRRAAPLKVEACPHQPSSGESDVVPAPVVPARLVAVRRRVPVMRAIELEQHSPTFDVGIRSSSSTDDVENDANPGSVGSPVRRLSTALPVLVFERPSSGSSRTTHSGSANSSNGSGDKPADIGDV